MATSELARLQADGLRLQQLIRIASDATDEAQRLAWTLERDLEAHPMPTLLRTAGNLTRELAENLSGNVHSGVAFGSALDDVNDLVDVVKLAAQQGEGQHDA